MRILFVSGTSVGGAARSTHELADALAERGHDVVTLMRVDEDERARDRHDRLLDGETKLAARGGRVPASLARTAGAVKRRVGTRLQPDPAGGGGHPAWRVPIVENAVGPLLRRHESDVVVVNSVERTAWREIRALLMARGVPSVLYLRETTGLRHLADPPTPPDLLLANAEAHAEGARRLGFACEYVPSVVQLDACRVESTRDHVLFVNPVPLYGVDVAVGLASARPDIPFVFQESWPISPADRAALGVALRALPNVELRAATDRPADVYRDARVLLFACTVPSRPRVVLEAQVNGIPVVAVDRPGHDEAVGPGGLLVPPGADLARWQEALAAVWDDADAYTRLSTAARAHAGRPEVAPDLVVARFEELVGGVTAPAR